VHPRRAALRVVEWRRRRSRAVAGVSEVDSSEVRHRWSARHFSAASVMAAFQVERTSATGFLRALGGCVSQGRQFCTTVPPDSKGLTVHYVIRFLGFGCNRYISIRPEEGFSAVDPDDLKRLQQGVALWNAYRENDADLSGGGPQGANLRGANSGGRTQGGELSKAIRSAGRISSGRISSRPPQRGGPKGATSARRTSSRSTSARASIIGMTAARRTSSGRHPRGHLTGEHQQGDPQRAKPPQGEPHRGQPQRGEPQGGEHQRARTSSRPTSAGRKLRHGVLIRAASQGETKRGQHQRGRPQRAHLREADLSGGDLRGPAAQRGKHGR